MSASILPFTIPDTVPEPITDDTPRERSLYTTNDELVFIRQCSARTDLPGAALSRCPGYQACRICIVTTDGGMFAPRALFRYDRRVELRGEIRSAVEAATAEVIAASRLLGRRQYHVALAGNVSVRVSEDLLVCTRHGADKEELTSADVVLCDLEGRKLGGSGEPTSELNMHRTAYRMRPEVRAVIHAHPPTATAYAAASKPLDQLQLPEMLVLLGPVGFVPYATPGSERLAENLGRLLPYHDAFLLENHGALTLGRSARQAALRMDLLEQNARITHLLPAPGKPFMLAAADREALMAFREPMADWGSEAAAGGG